MKKESAVPLWTRNFSLITIATILGAIGGIAGGFALSFLVFDETGSTLASALILAIQLVPHVFVPLFMAPLMDRLPRKKFLVCSDFLNGILYGALGLYLAFFDFSYIGFLGISVVLSSMGAIDSLAYNSLYPLLIAFFRTASGLTAAMYSLFSVAEFAGRSLGSLLQYRIKIPDHKKFNLVFGIYTTYEIMDMCLLWIPYPLMLVNRGVCGFLGNNSAILRNSAVQRYIPDHLRSRVNAFMEMLIMAAGSLLSLLIGALGEIMDYRLCMSICGGLSMLGCLLFIWLPRRHVRRIYEQPAPLSAPDQA